MVGCSTPRTTTGPPSSSSLRRLAWSVGSASSPSPGPTRSTSTLAALAAARDEVDRRRARRTTATLSASRCSILMPSSECRNCRRRTKTQNRNADRGITRNETEALKKKMWDEKVLLVSPRRSRDGSCGVTSSPSSQESILRGQREPWSFVARKHEVTFGEKLKTRWEW